MTGWHRRLAAVAGAVPIGSMQGTGASTWPSHWSVLDQGEEDQRVRCAVRATRSNHAAQRDGRLPHRVARIRSRGAFTSPHRCTPTRDRRCNEVSGITRRSGSDQDARTGRVQSILDSDRRPAVGLAWLAPAGAGLGECRSSSASHRRSPTPGRAAAWDCVGRIAVLLRSHRPARGAVRSRHHLVASHPHRDRSA